MSINRRDTLKLIGAGAAGIGVEQLRQAAVNMDRIVQFEERGATEIFSHTKPRWRFGNHVLEEGDVLPNTAVVTGELSPWEMAAIPAESLPVPQDEVLNKYVGATPHDAAINLNELRQATLDRRAILTLDNADIGTGLETERLLVEGRNKGLTAFLLLDVALSFLAYKYAGLKNRPPFSSSLMSLAAGVASYEFSNPERAINDIGSLMDRLGEEVMKLQESDVQTEYRKLVIDGRSVSMAANLRTGMAIIDAMPKYRENLFSKFGTTQVGEPDVLFFAGGGHTAVKQYWEAGEESVYGQVRAYVHEIFEVVNPFLKAGGEKADLALAHWLGMANCFSFPTANFMQEQEFMDVPMRNTPWSARAVLWDELLSTKDQGAEWDACVSALAAYDADYIKKVSGKDFLLPVIHKSYLPGHFSGGVEFATQSGEKYFKIVVAGIPLIFEL